MTYTFGPFTLSTDRLQLLRGRDVVALEPQVFALLRLLVENHDRVVTREEIFEAIWRDRVVTDATLSSRIKVARAAIGDDGGRQEKIRTVHGRGFHFVADVETVDAASLGRAEARPSLAVLPTEVISPTDQEESFAAGLNDDVVTALGKMRTLYIVRAPGNGDARRHAEELGVRYLLSTRIRFSGTRFRLNASLIHAISLEEVWNEQFSGEMDDPFLAQDRLTSALLGMLLPNILAVEIRRAVGEEATSTGAYHDFLRALPLCWAMTEEDNARAAAYLDNALAQDPNFALAHGLLSWRYGLQLLYRWASDPTDTLNRVQTHAEAALRGAENDTIVLTCVASAKMFAGEYKTAVHLLTSAVAFNPNFAWAHSTLGSANLFLGHVDAAIACCHRALELSPHDPIRFMYQMTLGTAYYAKGDHATAIRWLEQSVIENPNVAWGHRLIAACAADLGDALRTERAVAMILAQDPDATADSIVAATPPTDTVIRPLLGPSLRKAGL